MTIEITILDDGIRVSSGDHTATLHSPEPVALARKISADIRAESPTAQVITHLPKQTQKPLSETMTEVVSRHQMLSPSEVAQRLGVSRDVVYDLIRSGEIATVRVGSGKRKLHRIEQRELARFLDENREVA